MAKNKIDSTFVLFSFRVLQYSTTRGVWPNISNTAV